MKKTIILGILALIFTIYNINAQQRTAIITFTEKSFDFGNIKESGGSVTHVFNFTNTGTVPLIVQDANPSCGCTTPDWTKQPVMPGAKGYIKATFDPSGRPGKFDKDITVISNANTPSVVLKISGIVTAKAPMIQEEYRFGIDNLRVKTNYIFFGKLSPSSKRDTTIETINTGTTPLQIKFGNIPPMIKAEARPATLAPGAKGKLFISYDVSKKKDWGFLVDKLILNINNKIDHITIAVDIQEDFSKLTAAQLANAPAIKFEEFIKDMGTIKQGQVIDTEFKYTNTGKSDLVFRKFESSCGCTTVSPQGMTVKPGASGSLKVTFNSAGKRNRQNNTITVVSNDPKNPRIMLRMNAVIE